MASRSPRSSSGPTATCSTCASSTSSNAVCGRTGAIHPGACPAAVERIHTGEGCRQPLAQMTARTSSGNPWDGLQVTEMSTRKLLVIAMAITASVIVGRAQTLKKEGAVTATATITMIDSTTRAVTLRNEKGEEDTFTAGPDVKRFDQLKVGDKIRLTYYESLVLTLRKPGDASSASADTLAAGRTKSVPGGAVGVQQ